MVVLIAPFPHRRTACPTHQIGKITYKQQLVHYIILSKHTQRILAAWLRHQLFGKLHLHHQNLEEFQEPNTTWSQNKQTPSTKKGEWNHTMRPISTCKAQSMMAVAIAQIVDTIHVHKRKPLIPPSNVWKTFTDLLLPFRTRNYNIILAPAAHAPCRAAIRCNGGSCRSNLLIRALEIR